VRLKKNDIAAAYESPRDGGALQLREVRAKGLFEVNKAESKNGDPLTIGKSDRPAQLEYPVVTGVAAIFPVNSEVRTQKRLIAKVGRSLRSNRPIESAVGHDGFVDCPGLGNGDDQQQRQRSVLAPAKAASCGTWPRVRSVVRLRVRRLALPRVASVLSIVFAISGSANAAVTHFWKLDDNATNTTVLATVGNNGVFAENTTGNQAVGPGGSVNQGLTFDGNDTVTISGVSLSAGTTWSFSVWAKFGGTNGQLVGNFASGQNRIYKSSDTTINLTTSTTSSSFTVGSIGTTNWRHILVTHTAGNSVRVFLDGVESSTGPLTVAGSMTPPTIGSGNANYISGDLAWLKFYDTDESNNVALIYSEKYTTSLFHQMELTH